MSVIPCYWSVGEAFATATPYLQLPQARQSAKIMQSDDTSLSCKLMRLRNRHSYVRARNSARSAIDWNALFIVYVTRAISRYRQNALASSICLGVLHCTANKAGLATMTATHLARDTATFNRLRLYRNSIPRGASSGVDVAME